MSVTVKDVGLSLAGDRGAFAKKKEDRRKDSDHTPCDRRGGRRIPSATPQKSQAGLAGAGSPPCPDSPSASTCCQDSGSALHRCPHHTRRTRRTQRGKGADSDTRDIQTRPAPSRRNRYDSGIGWCGVPEQRPRSPRARRLAPRPTRATSAGPSTRAPRSCCTHPEHPCQNRHHHDRTAGRYDAAPSCQNSDKSEERRQQRRGADGSMVEQTPRPKDPCAFSRKNCTADARP
eukprot:2586868-Rhodomonas_salina.1